MFFAVLVDLQNVTNPGSGSSLSNASEAFDEKAENVIDLVIYYLSFIISMSTMSNITYIYFFILRTFLI